MIFIAYNFDNNCISIINARSKELALAFWQGKEIYPHLIKNLDEDFISLEEHPTGVFELVKVKEISGFDLHNTTDVGRSGRDKKYYLV